MVETKTFTPRNQSHNRRIASFVVGGVFAMTGLSYASVPLYRMFCAATGYNGTVQVAAGASAIKGNRTMTVRFDTNVAPGLPWSFEPEIASVEARAGETLTVFFKVHNKSGHQTAASALYNVTPDVSGAYFNKLACFCFNEQKLAANESAEFPVVFFLDPALEQDADMKRVESITLSYTFFASKDTSGLSATNSPVAPTASPPRL